MAIVEPMFDFRRAAAPEPFLMSRRVWLIAFQDDGRGGRTETIVGRDCRYVAAETGANLVAPEDDVLVYDPESNDFIYAAAVHDHAAIQETALREVVVRMVSSGVTERAIEMLAIDFRGGVPAARPEKGASAVRRLVDGLATSRSDSDTSHYCSIGLSQFSALDGAIEGLLLSALATNIANPVPVEAIGYLRRAEIAFGRSNMLAPRRTADEARRRLAVAAAERAQHSLPFDVPAAEHELRRSGPSRLGFASRHAVGFAVDARKAPHERPPRRDAPRRAVIGRIPASLLYTCGVLRNLAHDTFRPWAEVLDPMPSAGEVVIVRASLDGEFTSILGVAGRFSRTGPPALVRIEADNARIDVPVKTCSVGDLVYFELRPSGPGVVRAKIMFVPQGSRVSSISLSFRVS